MEQVDATIQLRRMVYALLTIVTVAALAARVVDVELVYEPSLHRADRIWSPMPRRVWPRTAADAVANV